MRRWDSLNRSQRTGHDAHCIVFKPYGYDVLEMICVFRFLPDKRKIGISVVYHKGNGAVNRNRADF